LFCWLFYIPPKWFGKELNLFPQNPIAETIAAAKQNQTGNLSLKSENIRFSPFEPTI